MSPKSMSEDQATDYVSDGKFLRIGIHELEVFIQLTASKLIQHRDVTVFLAFISLTDWRSGRCRASCKKVAELIGKPQSYISISVKRLKETNMMVPSIDKATGERFFLINPDFLICGSGSRRGFLVKTYKDAIDENKPFIGKEEDSESSI